MENVNIIPFNEVEAEEVSWLFYPYIAYGKLTLLGGEAGCGKTMVALALASILSNGGKLPLQTEETKPIKGNRVIPLTDTMLQKLLVHRARQLFEKQRLGRAYSDNGYVFANEFGGLIEPNYLRKVYMRILEDAKVPFHHFHTIRHTFATRAIENDMPVKVVSEIMGHSSVQLTMDLYCHPSISAKRNVLEKMENL